MLHMVPFVISDTRCSFPSTLWRPLTQADNRQLAALTNYKSFALWYQTVSMSDCLLHFAAHLLFAGCLNVPEWQVFLILPTQLNQLFYAQKDKFL